MGTLKLRIETTQKALLTLKAITEEPYSIISFASSSLQDKYLKMKVEY